MKKRLETIFRHRDAVLSAPARQKQIKNRRLFDAGVREGKSRAQREIAEALGLYEIFELKHEDE